MEKDEASTSKLETITGLRFGIKIGDDDDDESFENRLINSVQVSLFANIYDFLTKFFKYEIN